MSAKDIKEQKRINVQVPANLEDVYSNFALITHSAWEIIIDFARLLPNSPNAKVYSRVVMTPMNAKLLLRALGENLGKFEAQFGEIRLPEQQSFDGGRPIGFRHDD